VKTERPSIAGRAVGAGAWTIGTRLIAKLIDLGILLCLARFLGPAEFGLVAIAMAVLFIVEALFELPIAAALIRVPALSPNMLHTAFTLSLMRGLLIALILFSASWPLASFNDEPRLKALLAVLALAPALRGLVSPRMVEYARALNFRPDAVMELSGKIVAFAVSVTIAATTRSYWAIAAATVCGPLVTTLLSYYVAPLKIRLTLTDWKQFSSLVGWNFISQLGSALNWQIDRLLLPRLTTTVVFGQYTMGKQISEIPTQALMQPLVRPAMSALALAGESRGSRYLKLSHSIALVMLPVMGVLLFWPEELVLVTLGPAWSPAAEWLRLVSAAALLSIPAVLMGPLAMTMDRAHWLAVRSLIELLLRLPLVWIGAMHFGILGAVIGGAVATASGTLIALFVVKNLTGIGLAPQLMMIGRPLMAMLPACAVLWLAKFAFTTASMTEIIVWALPFSMLYLTIYALSTLVVWRLVGSPPGVEQHLLNMVRKRLIRVQSVHGR
jgi:O-antigen/teichoic acid export membrane protein